MPKSTSSSSSSASGGSSKKRAATEQTNFCGQPSEIGFVEPSRNDSPLPKPPSYSDAARDAALCDEEMGYVAPSVGGALKISDCTDQSLRAGFIGKVYAVLCFELLITFFIVSLFTLVRPIKNFFSSTDNFSWTLGLLITSLVVFIVIYITIMLCKSARRKVPYNYVFVAIFSTATGFLLGIMASFFDVITVVEAMASLSVICFFMTLFGCQSKIPFDALFIAIFTLTTTLLCVAIFGIFTNSDGWLLLYLGLAVALLSLILLIDTWLVLNSGHHEVMLEEYVFCSLILYVDIIYIFIYLLMLLGGSARN